jgi:hypothetical protein
MFCRRYRHDYPGKSLSNPSMSRNLRFYSNTLASSPRGGLIEDMHNEWLGQYKLLERHHVWTAVGVGVTASCVLTTVRGASVCCTQS